jgi:hypothetical protein
MKKISLLLAAALALAACGPQDPADKFRNALPKTQAVTVGTPQSDSGTGALSVQTSALGESAMLQSEYAVMSYYLAVTMNTGVAWILGTVHFITTFKPTSCDDSSCTWGPWIDDDGNNRWKLFVAKVGDTYEWTLSAQNGLDANGPFVDFIKGVARPVDGDHGSGNFTVYFDAQDALYHGPLYVKRDFGELRVTYDNTQGAYVRADFVDAVNQDPDPAKKGHVMNAAYEFDAASSGGQLQVAFQDENTQEVARIRSRWSPGGAGRADIEYDPDGIAGVAAYTETECWAGRSQDFAEVYDSYPAYGVESSCSPFSTRLDPNLPLP